MRKHATALLLSIIVSLSMHGVHAKPAPAQGNKKTFAATQRPQPVDSDESDAPTHKRSEDYFKDSDSESGIPKDIEKFFGPSESELDEKNPTKDNAALFASDESD